MKKSCLYLLLYGGMILITACQKTIDKPLMNSEEQTSASSNNAKVKDKKVYVSTLDELYAAVNNPDHAGTEVIIAPGTYVLNASYPNGGRLELQTDMSLKGQPGQVDAVLIDESALPASSFSIPLTLTAAVRLGRGTNTLEWLSLKGGLLSSNAFAVVGCDLPSTETRISISHVKVVSNGSRIGIDIRNRLPEHAGRKIYAEVSATEISGFVNSLGFGMTAFNLNDASNALISVTMKGNYIHGNKIGLITNNGTAGTRNILNSSVEIMSYADRLEGNGCALDPSGGVSSSATGVANDNSVSIKMYGTSIRDNNPPGAPELAPVNGALPCGMYPVAGYSSFNGIGGNNKTSNNLLKIELWGCDISNNNGADIYAYGAWCNPLAILAGTNNIVDISLHGISANATVSVVNSSPVEAAGTNVVNIYR